MFMRKQYKNILLILDAGLKLYKQCFIDLFPLSLIWVALGYIVYPNALPNLAEPLDWALMMMFFAGLFGIAIVHTSLVLSIKSIVIGKKLGLKKALRLGLRKAKGVLAVGLIVGLASGLPGLLMLFSNESNHAYISLGSGLLMLCVSVYFIPALIIYVWKKRGIIESIQESFQLVSENYGNFSKTLLLFILFATGFAILEWPCRIFMRDQVVVATGLCLFLRALYLPLGYTLLLTFLLKIQPSKKNKAPLTEDVYVTDSSD